MASFLSGTFQIKKECLACRGAAAVFNMSYFGKFYLVGLDARKAADWLFSADVSRPPGTTSRGPCPSPTLLPGRTPWAQPWVLRPGGKLALSPLGFSSSGLCPLAGPGPLRLDLSALTATPQALGPQHLPLSLPLPFLSLLPPSLLHLLCSRKDARQEALCKCGAPLGTHHRNTLPKEGFQN